MELFRALAALVEPPTDSGAAQVAEALGLGQPPEASEHTELFAFQLYPYASVYLGAEGMMGGEARDRVAGFLAALGLVPPAEPDHLSVMLAIYARLCELGEGEADPARRDGWRRARRAFLWEHLLSWLPAYLDKLRGLAPPFYAHWGALLEEALLEEARAAGPPTTLSLHLREPLNLIDPRAAGYEAFLSSLLAPARAGLIITRADLSRAARALGLGTRVGERRFMLRALFGQDARATLGWLAREADDWGVRHRRHEDVFGPAARVWRGRAEAAAALCRELAASAER